ncbi:aminotransferase class I/II-fold pyridoxal phosphate-dependent enzyme [Candidatus Vidania fulgoroideorum]
MINKKILTISLKNFFVRKKEIDLSIGEFKKKNNFLKKIKKKLELYKLYPNINKIKKFNNSVKKWIKKRYSIKVSVKNICPSLGNRDGLFTSFLFFLNKKKYIAIFKPYYPIYKNLIFFFKKKIILLNKRNYKKKIKKYKKKINIIIICSPNNPTGYIYNKIFLNYIKKTKINIISDDCYSEIYLKKYTSLINILSNFKNIIFLNSLSKRSSVPGLRSGFLLSSKKNIKKIKNIKNISGTILSDYNQYISSKLWKDENHIKKKRKKLNKIILNCIKILNKNKINFNFPKGTFYLWINVKKDIDFCKKIYKKYFIKIFPGTFFGKKNFIRIALVENKKKCLYSIKKIVKFLNDRKNKIKNKKYLSKK